MSSLLLVLILMLMRTIQMGQVMVDKKILGIAVYLVLNERCSSPISESQSTSIYSKVKA